MRFISFLFSLLPFDELYIGDLDFQDVLQKRLQILLITHHHAEHVVIHNRQPSSGLIPIIVYTFPRCL